MSIEVIKSYTVDPEKQTATTATEKVEPKTPVEADPKPETAATSAETDTTAPDQAVEGEEPKPKKADGGFQRRINKLTARVSEAEARAAKAEQELQARAPAKSADDPEPVRPDPSKFDDWDKLDRAKEEYITEKAAWKARQEVKQSEAKRTDQDRAKDNQARIKAANETFEKRLAEVEDRYEGIHEAVEAVFAKDSDVPVSGPMAEYIMEVSDRGPELVFALHAKPEEAERISKLSPLAAARELAKLEATLPKPEPKKTSGAPPPPKQVKGSAESPTKKLEDMSMAEYMAHRREQEKKSGKYQRVV
jgi:hypothetical protein